MPLRSESMVIAGCNFSYNAPRIELTSVCSSLKDSMRKVRIIDQVVYSSVRYYNYMLLHASASLIKLSLSNWFLFSIIFL